LSSFSFHSKNNVFGLSFHHLLIILLFPLQSLCFYKCMFYCVFLQHLVLASAISFVYCEIHFGKFFFMFLHNVLVKEARLVVMVDDLDFKIWDVAFEAKVLNRYGTFDWIENRSMGDPCYAYLHCDLLDMAALTIIILKVKSPYIEMHEQHL
jgi:hypothetical protein